MRGPTLGSWLKNLTEVTLDEPGIQRVWKVIERQTLSRDEQGLAYSGPPRPTFNKFILRSILAPFFAVFTGFMSALYGLLAIIRFHQTWLFGGVVAFLVIGIVALRISFLRRAAKGWLASLALVILISVGDVIRAHFR